MERAITLIDMDCFYVQVEQRLNPDLKGKPCAVVQYNQWKGGGIIAVSYEARACGVTRQMRGEEAKKLCPEIQLPQVPVVRDKANLTRYREAGAEVIDVLTKFSPQVERASVDEAFVDLTEDVERRLRDGQQISSSQLPNTHIVGWEQGPSEWLASEVSGDNLNYSEKKLAMCAVIVEEMRAAVFAETGFRCSAGIAQNKMLAKLCCAFHKPNQQTVLPHAGVPELFATLPIQKIRNLGGKFGCSIVEQLDVTFAGDVCKFSEQQLHNLYGEKNGTWLYNACRGFEHDPVIPRQLAKSIGCGKNFPGKGCLDTRDKVKHWLSKLAEEIQERLMKDREVNKRVAKSLNVSLRYLGNPDPIVASRTCALTRCDAKKIADDAFALLQKYNVASSHQQDWAPAIVNLNLSVSKFTEDAGVSNSNISQFMGKGREKKSSPSHDAENLTNLKNPSSTTKTKTVTNEPSVIKSPKRKSLEMYFKSNTTNTAKNVVEVKCMLEAQVNSDKPLKLENVGFFKSKTATTANTTISDCLQSKQGVSEVKPHEMAFNRKKSMSGFFEKQKQKNPAKSVDPEFFKSLPEDIQTELLQSLSSLQKQTLEINLSSNTCRPDECEKIKFESSFTFPDNSIKFKTGSDNVDDGAEEFAVSTVYNDTSKANTDNDQDCLNSYKIVSSNSADLTNQSCGLSVHLYDNDKSWHHGGDASVRTVSTDYDNIENGEQLSGPSCDIEPPDNNDVVTSPDDYVSCEQCDEKILAWDLPEHLDYHFAMSLQKERHQVTGVKRKTTEDLSNKTKKTKTADQVKTLHSFFSQDI